MSPRLGIAAAITVVVAALGALGVFMLRAAIDDEGMGTVAEGTAIAAVLDDAEPAMAPFAGLTEVRLGLDGRCLRVVVADQLTERQQGLRGISDLVPYDGMLFVFGADTDTQFVMGGVPIALDIGWYTATGLPVDRTTMEPCPDATDANCPKYGPTSRYRLALETPAGGLGGGALGACA